MLNKLVVQKKYGTGIRTNLEGKTATQPAATYHHLKEGPYVF